ncbi:uncharacterized protein LOC115210451 [Octopus sinensis]|uniref:Uncharacterized protein LOC115210451 n=1 Tax=Octopus sinensis TaxID=2607531 RepID=A0A7E6ES73_9MOLL|nr:uncharacterized protein LOC115210451 [Octopus sinensis]
MAKTRHIKKFMKLKGQRMKTEVRHPPVKAVINVSSRHLESFDEAVLKKGLNFATTIKRIPYLDIIAPIEETVVKIPKAPGDELRWKVRQVLEKVKPLKPNITKEERFAIKGLQSDNSIIILPADKGNATVVINKSDYSEKLASLISDGSYCKEKKDPILKTKRKLSQILIKNKDHLTPINFLVNSPQASS